jgi:hypothetical protein
MWNANRPPPEWLFTSPQTKERVINARRKSVSGENRDLPGHHRNPGGAAATAQEAVAVTTAPTWTQVERLILIAVVPGIPARRAARSSSVRAAQPKVEPHEPAVLTNGLCRKRRTESQGRQTPHFVAQGRYAGRRSPVSPVAKTPYYGHDAVTNSVTECGGRSATPRVKC